jgi:hypothetical protein
MMLMLFWTFSDLFASSRPTSKPLYKNSALQIFVELNVVKKLLYDKILKQSN